MAEDPYKILGVAKDAGAPDIRAAYRRLAKQHHPDLNPGNKSAEEQFKAVAAAHELLSDPEKRARYDRGEIDEAGAEKAPPRGYRHYAESAPGQRYAYSSAPEGFSAGAAGGSEDFEDIFSTLFQNRGNAGGQPARGRDAHYVLSAPFLDAVNGGQKRLTLPDGQVLDVKIPAGTQDGDILRLRGRGAPGRNNAPAGDALIEINVLAHPFFTRDGQDIRFELPISVQEAVLGARITAPTPAGPVILTVRPHADSGTEMRLSKRGVPKTGSLEAGDLYVKLRVVIGPVDEKLEAFLKAWKPDQTFDPRATLEGGGE